ncbi:MAG TPA: DUF447 domain-containing protein [Pirellulaceae bacterium]|nr:DUF447 domain-containing protein [Pirellulaceae bacterium]
MILEGIVTTLNADGTTNISPMGPRVSPDMQRFTLRPYNTSTTYRNLKRHGLGVLHVTDDVELLALAAIGQLTPPPLERIENFPVPRLADTCRWFAFRVTLLDDAAERTTIDCEQVATGHVRDFFGFNRAKHAVLEGAILATRIHLLPAATIREEFARLQVLVEKTAGESEQRAWRLLTEFIEQKLPSV